MHKTLTLKMMMMIENALTEKELAKTRERIKKNLKERSGKNEQNQNVEEN